MFTKVALGTWSYTLNPRSMLRVRQLWAGTCPRIVGPTIPCSTPLGFRFFSPNYLEAALNETNQGGTLRVAGESIIKFPPKALLERFLFLLPAYLAVFDKPGSCNIALGMLPLNAKP